METGLTSILSHICLLCSQFLGKGGGCVFVSVEGGGGVVMTLYTLRSDCKVDHCHLVRCLTTKTSIKYLIDSS